MKKIIFCISILFSCFFSFCKAQDTIKRKGFISLDMGKCFAGAGFAGNSVSEDAYNDLSTNNLNGYATSGNHIDIKGGYLLFWHIGAMGMFAYEQYLPDATHGVIFSGDFYLRQYLIGPYISTARKEKVNFRLSVLLGEMSSNFPSYYYSSSTHAINSYGALGPYYFTDAVTIEGTKGFEYCIDGQMEMNLYKGIAFNLGISYLGATLSYPEWTTNYERISPTYTSDAVSSNTPTKMTMSNFQITVGTSFHFL